MRLKQGFLNRDNLIIILIMKNSLKLSEYVELIKDKDFWLILFDIIFLISPGILVLFTFYRNDIFISIDVLKLILLSISISGPLAMVNIATIIVSTIDSKKSDKINFGIFTVGILSGGVVFYVSLLFYFTVLKLPFNSTAYDQLIGWGMDNMSIFATILILTECCFVYFIRKDFKR